MSMMMAAVGAQALQRATYVGEQHLEGAVRSDGGTAYTTLPLAATGAQAGDFCMVFTFWGSGDQYPTITGGDEGWSRDNYTWSPAYGYKNTTLHKKLTALDLTSTVRLSAAMTSGIKPLIGIVVYRGVNVASRKTIAYDDAGGTTSTTPGFVKSYTNVGVVAYIADRDLSGAITESIAGGAIVERVEYGSTSGRIAIADALGKDDYPDGAAISWAGLGNAGPYGQVSQLYELVL